MSAKKTMSVGAVSIIFSACFSYMGHADICWKMALDRGPTIPSACPTGQVQSGLDCYQDIPGYEIVGGVAVQKCTAGSTDFGGVCCPAGTAFANSAACTIKARKALSLIGPMTQCPAYEEIAGLCYTRCGTGFETLGGVCLGKCPADKPINCGGCAEQLKLTAQIL